MPPMPRAPMGADIQAAMSATSREAAILAARAEGLTLREIGARFGISGERARQILKRARATFRAAPDMTCSSCGSPLARSSARPLCKPCRARLAKTRLCRACGAPFTAIGRATGYCPACRVVTRPCAWCGRPVTRDRGRQRGFFRNHLWFCTRSCFGKYVGTRHGFRARRPQAASPVPLPPRIRRAPGGHMLVLPYAIARRFAGDGRVTVTVGPRSITLSRPRAGGGDTRARKLARISRSARTRSVYLGSGPLPEWVRHGAVLRPAVQTRSSVVLVPDAAGLPGPAPLPPGYSVTRSAGLAVLWRDATCVTVFPDSAADETIAQAALRDAAARDKEGRGRAATA